METKKLQSFKDLNVWQKSSNLAVLVYKITEKFPKSELYGLTNQMRRSAVSTSSNIAEGFKRRHKKEKLQFYNIAYSSVAEIESQIEISNKLGYLSKSDYQKLTILITEISKMTDSLLKSVHKNFLNPKFYVLAFFIFLYSIFYILIPLSIQAATLYFVPQSQEVYQGDTIMVEARIDTEGEEINTAEIHLSYPYEFFSPIDFSKGGSVLNLFAQEPRFKDNEISFIGGTPNGFAGDGLLAKITFLSKKSGQANFDFTGDSKILLNDGKASPAGLNIKEGIYSIVNKPKELPIIISESHPDQNKWYNNNTLSLYWDLIEGVEYSWVLSRDPLTEPDEIIDEPMPKEGVAFWMGAMEYDLKEEGDGIYYFILKQKLSGGSWSKSVKFRAMIDTAPPQEFQFSIAEIEGKNYLVFSAIDAMSGVARYEILETPTFSIFSKERTWETGESPYLLKDQTLQSNILIRAIDKAGNEKIIEIAASQKPLFLWIVIILILIVIIIVRLVKSRRAKYVKKDNLN